MLPVSEREVIADITQSFKHYELSRSWILYNGIFKYYRLNCGLDLFFNTPMLCSVAVGGGSDLRLWTVNGDLVGHVHCRESICSVAFSNQPEGVSVNVIAGGLENGVVR